MKTKQINKLCPDGGDELVYDNNGNITSITDLVNPAKSQTFAYDALDRLRTANGAYGSKTYDYDAAGNRLGDGVDELVYDDNGNVIGDGALGYEYEAGPPVPGGQRSSNEENIYAYANNSPLVNIDPNGLGLIGLIWNCVKCEKYKKLVMEAADKCDAEEDKDEVAFGMKYGGGVSMGAAKINCIKQKDPEAFKNFIKYCGQAALKGIVK